MAPPDSAPGRLSMYMQPVVQLGTGKVHRFEALARLVTDDGDVLLPGQFLPTMSRDGLATLFRNGVEQVLEHLATWRRRGLVTTASVNISPTTLRDPQCAAWVASALERHEVAPQRLLLEVLEDEVMDSAVQRDTLHAMRDLGVASVVDDMGVGYSTLARMTGFPFLGAKVDRSYVASIAADPVSSLGRIDAFVRLSRDLGWDLAIEGIETVAVGEAVAALGALRAQGYLFARPMPPDRVPGFVPSFRSPVRAGQVTTALGALGHHWEVGMPTGPFAACPVSGFLSERAPAEVATWHARVHACPEDLAAGASLVDWLTRRAARTSS